MLLTDTINYTEAETKSYCTREMAGSVFIHKHRVIAPANLSAGLMLGLWIAYILDGALLRPAITS